METFSVAYTYACVLLYFLSGFCFYLCFYLLYIAGVSRQLELHYGHDYKQRYLDGTNISATNINLIWRKIHNLGLIGTILLSLTVNFIMFIPIIFALFSIYYISSYSAKLIAKSYSSQLLTKLLSISDLSHPSFSKYNTITPQKNK